MSGAMRRVCQTVDLDSDSVQRYIDLHATIPSQIEARLWDSHVRNYTIFLRGVTLVGYYEYVGEDYEADMAAIAADPATQEWWQLTGPCQVDPNPDAPGGPWRDLDEVFRMAEPAQDR